MSMEISDKDKNLLYGLIAILIIAGAFFFGLKNFNNQKDIYVEKMKSYNEEYDSLIVLQKDRPKYIEDTQKYRDDAALVVASFTNGYTQENLIKTIADIENNIDVYVSEINFIDPEVVYEFRSIPNAIGIKSSIGIEFQGDYEPFKAFLSEILAIDSKVSINTLSAQWEDKAQFIGAAITIDHFAVEADDREPFKTKIDMPVGLGNIFQSNSIASAVDTSYSAGSYILSDYDISVLLSQPEADIDSVIVGTTSDSKAKDSISSDKNETQELLITVDGSDGKYTVSYKLGDETYPSKNYEKGADFEPGDTLDILVMSSVRSDNKDKVSIKASIENNSDMPLQLLVSGDDNDSPRFSVANRTGNVTIYR